VDIGAFTDRQRQVAELANEKGYFENDEAGAEAVATELDIAQSTVSKHLRAVIRKLLSQIYG
jgi:predicted DNA binding protein